MAKFRRMLEWGEVPAMQIGRFLMGVVYVGAGVMHFVATRAYERIMPGYLPEHHALVLVSGVAEIAGGVGVMLPQRFFAVRRAAAWGIVALLVAVWPANVWMAQHPELTPGVPVWGLWVRVGFQVVLIGWAWRYTPDQM